MNDDKPRGTPADETQPVRPDGTLPPAPPPAASPAASPDPAPAAASTAYEPGAGPPVGRRGFRDRFRSLRSSDGSRTFGLGALIASALAGVIVGGLGGAVVHAVTDDHPRGGWAEHGPMGRDDDRDRGGRGPMFGGPGGLPGQGQPTTPPEDDSSEG